MDKSLPLPKDASMHLRKLVGHPCPPHAIYSNALQQLRWGLVVTSDYFRIILQTYCYQLFKHINLYILT